MKLLPREFYKNEDVVFLAKQLLGKHIFSHAGGYKTSGIIVETEAYRAPEDKASHAYGNKKTNRTKTMFEKPGTAYIYLVYGFHHLFNVVTAPEDVAHAVLIRAVEPLEGIDKMFERRNRISPGFDLTNGPGKWTQAFGITTDLNGLDLSAMDSLIQIFDPGVNIPDDKIIAGPRVGIDYAEEWAKKPWRFRIKDSKWAGK